MKIVHLLSFWISQQLSMLSTLGCYSTTYKSWRLENLFCSFLNRQCQIVGIGEGGKAIFMAFDVWNFTAAGSILPAFKHLYEATS